MKDLLYGRQPVRECLRSHRRHVHRLLLATGVKETGVVGDILGLSRSLRIPVERADRTQLERVSEAHQGVVLEVGAYPYVVMEDVLRSAQKQGQRPFMLALDHLQDPHNLGALLRTADAVGVHGVVIPERRAVGVTPAVVSASAGASEHVRVVQVTNLVRSLEVLKGEGLWIVGMDSDPASSLYHQVDLDRSLLLLVGAEGTGLGHLVRQSCDLLIRLPMCGRLQSLNASVAGGIALYAAWAARGFPVN